ncbi:MAG: sugar-binding transcriptional regulator [Candidatus Nanopelagicales bacterium]
MDEGMDLMTVEQRRDGARTADARAPLASLSETEALRLVTRVAWLYHVRSMKQSEVADELGLSQSRVSRLLDAAVSLGIVTTTVRVPPGLHVELEHALQDAYGLRGAYVFDLPAVSDDSDYLVDLGRTLAAYLIENPLVGDIIGFTSWSRTLRETVRVLEITNPATASYVVEMLGDVGPPEVQHGAADVTQQLARMTGAQPRFLRVPGVVTSREVRDTILGHDNHARETLAMLDRVDEALVGIGTCKVDAPIRPGENFFTLEQMEHARQLGAVGQVNLRFIDEAGNAIESELDELVIGVRLDQLRSFERSIAVAGGPGKYAAIRGSLLGGWVNTLITDVATAQHLVAKAP